MSHTGTLFRSAAPHPALARYVRAYVGADGLSRDVVPLAAVPAPVLLLSWGAPVRVVTASDRPLPAVALLGPGSRVHRAEVEPGAVGFHVRFTPTGGRALLGERAAPDVWDDGLPADVRAEAVADAPTFQARVALADAFFRARIPGAEVWSEAAAWRIVRSGGVEAATGVGAALGVSARTLRRRFRDDVGVGPKAFAQAERYRQAHALLLRSPRATWREACERFEYCDQAHLDRAFQRYAGAPPTRWRPEDHAFDLGFGLRDEGATDVGGRADRFVQDRAPGRLYRRG